MTTQYIIENRMKINPHPAKWFICRSFDTKREAVAELRLMLVKYPNDKLRLRSLSLDY